MENIEQYISLKGVIFFHGKVLLLREGDYAANTSKGNWQFPGGRIDRGEHFQDGLIREVKEETGLDIKFGKPFYMSEWFPSPKVTPWHVVAVFVLCESESEEVVVSEEHDAFQWLAPEEVLKLENVSVGIKEAIEEYLKDKNS